MPDGVPTGPTHKWVAALYLGMADGRTQPIRRTIADLRALCNGRAASVTNPGTGAEEGDPIALDCAADDNARARRLERHGWVRDHHRDAGEGHFAVLTEAGAALYRHYWAAVEDGEIDALLDPEHGGGVGVFCDAALADETADR